MSEIVTGDKMRMAELHELRVEDIYQAYVGRKEGCRCGCNGDYSSSSFAPKEEQSSEVNDRKVANTLRTMNRLVGEGCELEFMALDGSDAGGFFFNVTNENGRVYSVYTNPAKQAEIVARGVAWEKGANDRAARYQAAIEARDLMQEAITKKRDAEIAAVQKQFEEARLKIEADTEAAVRKSRAEFDAAVKGA
jgi:hypothetical protein